MSAAHLLSRGTQPLPQEMRKNIFIFISDCDATTQDLQHLDQHVNGVTCIHETVARSGPDGPETATCKLAKLTMMRRLEPLPTATAALSARSATGLWAILKGVLHRPAIGCIEERGASFLQPIFSSNLSVGLRWLRRICDRGQSVCLHEAGEQYRG